MSKHSQQQLMQSKNSLFFGYPSATGREHDRKVRRPKTDVIPLFQNPQLTVYIH